MRSAFVEITKAALIQNIRKMALAKNDDVIQTLSPYAPKKAFAPGIHERRLDCHSHDFHSGTLCHSVEFSTELVVVIANDHIGTLAERSQHTLKEPTGFQSWRVIGSRSGSCVVPG